MGAVSGVAVSCGVGHRHSSDPTLLCLWCRPTAIALIQPLAWESPYAAGSVLKKKKCSFKEKQEYFDSYVTGIFSFSGFGALNEHGIIPLAP